MGRGKVYLRAKWPIMPELISVSVAPLKWQGVFLLLPGWDASLQQGYPTAIVLNLLVPINTPAGLYIRACSQRSSPASLPGFAGYFHCFASQDMLRRWCLSGPTTVYFPQNPSYLKTLRKHCTWMERCTVIVGFLAQEHNTMSPARALTQAAQSRGKHTNNEATVPSGYIYINSGIRFIIHNNIA